MYLPSENGHYKPCTILLSLLFSFLGICVLGSRFLCAFLLIIWCGKAYYLKQWKRLLLGIILLVVLLIAIFFPQLLWTLKLCVWIDVTYHFLLKISREDCTHLLEKIYYPFLDGNHLENFIFYFHGPSIFLHHYKELEYVPARRERIHLTYHLTKGELLLLKRTYEMRYYGISVRRTGEIQKTSSLDLFCVLVNLCFLLVAILMRGW